MPHKILLEDLPAGISQNNARSGETVLVKPSGLFSSEDGTELVRHLEMIASPFLAKTASAQSASTIDHLMAVISANKEATVYVNELELIGQVKAKRDFDAGEMVLCDDIADLRRLTIKGIEIPNDAGLVLVLSAGWRKALFFDFAPLHGLPREADIEILMASIWSYIRFQDRTQLSDDEWQGLLQQGWFPFIGLTTEQVRQLVGHVKAGWNADDLLPEIAASVSSRCTKLADAAEKHGILKDHAQTIRAGANHFTSGDYLSTSAVLYPRIEGILRSQAQRLSNSPSYKQGALAEAAAIDASGTRNPQSLLLPERFRTFLEKVYFAGFDPQAPSNVSRHTISHGVAPEHKMNQKSATIALLILEQLNFLCG